MILVNNLSRYFGATKAVDNISIYISEGEFFGLLGANGAGKTTTVRMLATLLPQTSGTIEINGLSVPKQSELVRHYIGYVPQALSSDGTLTGYENLLIFAKLVGLRKQEREERIHNMLALMELENVSNKLVRDFSGGMIRKLEIAQSLLHQPKVLLLDEPTVGLDPIARRSVWEVLETLRKEFKVTILLTTHYMDEAEALCDRLAILEHGKIITLGAPEQIMANTNTTTLEEAFIALLGHHIDEGGNFGETRTIRRTTRRLR